MLVHNNISEVYRCNMSSLYLILLTVYFLFETTGSTSVIVVGAGPAGIAAATKLLENNISDVRILEAEDRIGGRINSVQCGAAFIDVGAEFCHGEKDNIVYELVQNYDLLDRRDRWAPGLYYSNGSKIDSEEILKMITIYDDLSELLANETNTNLSIGEFILKRYESPALENYLGSDIDPELRTLLNESTHLAENMILGLEGSFSWFSSSALSHYEECEGNQGLTWKGQGYKIILDILMKAYPDPKQKLPIDDKILLNKKVVKIDRNETSITVSTEDKSTYTTDYVIFTPSIGVLKKYKEDLFSPHLPQYKNDAINAIGFDGVMKIIVRFSEKWWKDADVGMLFLWSDEDRKASGKQFPHGPEKDGVSWITNICYIGSQSKDVNPNVAILWVLGDTIPKLEQESKETIQKGVEYVLNKFLSADYNISGIEEIIWSKWCSNQNFLGTYSFLKTGFYDPNISYYEQLSKPILSEPSKNSGLLFAGEATNPKHYSTVHGAIETGHREALRIVHLHNEV